jgi:hypothetical protein
VVPEPAIFGAKASLLIQPLGDRVAALGDHRDSSCTLLSKPALRSIDKCRTEPEATRQRMHTNQADS